MEAPTTSDLIAHFQRDASHWGRMIARAQLQPATASATDVSRWQYYQVASAEAAKKLALLPDSA